MLGTALHIFAMIKSFRSKALKLFWEKADASKLSVPNEARVRRQLDALDASVQPDDMDVPGWRYHGFQGKPKRYAVDASGNYRMTFGFESQDAIAVDLEDYH